MGNRLFANNASATIAVNVTTGATTITLAAGFGQYFPNPSGTQYFICTLEDNVGNIEYMKCTGRSTDTLTVTRAQEGTSALAVTQPNGRVEYRMTAAQAASFLQKDGDTLTGALNLGAQTVTNGVLSGTGITIEGAGEIVNTPLRGVTGGAGNQITVPTDGTSRPQIGGVNITIATDVANAFFAGFITMYSGALGNLPFGWYPCDGGTHGAVTPTAVPNLQNQFVVGSGNSYTTGNTGAIAGVTSSVSGATPSIISPTIATANLPAHTHPFDYAAGNGSVQYFGIPGYTLPSDYIFNGSGTGARNSFAGSSTGNGVALPITANPDTPHSHTTAVTTGGYYALAFVIYLGQ